MRYPHRAQNGHKTRRRGFTLTELLIVVAIIAVLASLVTAAAINAMRNARRARILLEMKMISQALETMRGDVGAYPPNVFPAASTELGLSQAEKDKNLSALRTFLSKASNRSIEKYNIGTMANYGLSPAEALVFWLQGFSSDEQRPLSGTDLVVTSIDGGESIGTIENVVTIDSFKPRYDFDRGRLRISIDPETDEPRMLEFRRVDGDTATTFNILLYEYLAAGSEKPLIYFDTSRYTPYQMFSTFPTGEFFFKDTTDPTSFVVPLKRLKQNAPKDPADLKLRQHLEYVDQRKFQIMHPGLDDAWGDFSAFEIKGVEDSDLQDMLFYPDGPFVGDVADTLTNYFDGPLADAQENE